ncbi:MAG TPA: sigma-70 family RNA polymerase sigma factor [Gemmataceae bacterium]|nr:sigma-70 family RNA polymerase sigma factor [Gemmataceae bacterium]
MAGTRHHSLLQYLRQTLGTPTGTTVGDGDLLRRFVEQRDEAAFELLLWRHAAMVLHVCRHVLGDADAAEDAFQATFLVLVRKAGSISRREALGAWLYRVAYHIALKARTEMRKRRNVEQDEENRHLPILSDDATEREQRQIIAEEVHRLPAKFRAAIVACYFEAKTLDEAAKQLGWPRGTVASRLARGRELLRRRLLRRGVALTLGALSTVLSAPLSTTALTRLIHATIPNVKHFAASSSAAAVMPPRISALAEGGLQAMAGTRRKSVMVALVLAGLGGVGTTFWAAAPQRAEPLSESTSRTAAVRPDDKAKPREDAAKFARDMAQSRLNLRKLALAMHDYADANHAFFPPPALINKEGKEVLSWRVLLLPYLGERELYEKFNLSEPWDSPHNKKLLSKMPAVYAAPGVKTREPYSTFYRVFFTPKPKGAGAGEEPVIIGLQAAFVQGRSSRLPASFPDGLANTILIIEAGQAVPWTKPEELPYANNAAPLPELGGLFRDVFQTVFVDGHVETLTKKYNEYFLRTVITSNGGEVMDFDTIRASSAAAEWRRKNRQLQQELEEARERLHRLHEEQDVLRGQPLKKTESENDAPVQELKKENARLQKEFDQVNEEQKSLSQEIQRSLQKSSTKKNP